MFYVFNWFVVYYSYCVNLSVWWTLKDHTYFHKPAGEVPGLGMCDFLVDGNQALMG